MDRIRRNPQANTKWRLCLECGNRYQAAKHGYLVNWCSVTCEDASFRRQREQVETSWMSARWFLR